MSQDKELKREERISQQKKIMSRQKWQSNETSQDKLVSTKTSTLQQTVQLVTKIKKEICCNIFKACHDIEFRFSNAR